MKLTRSLPSSVEIENEWSYAFTPSNGMDRDDFTGFYLCDDIGVTWGLGGVVPVEYFF